MKSVRNETMDRARRALEVLTALPIVVLRFDGGEFVAAFDLNGGEHERRTGAGVGAVTSRSLLHGLWLLPGGVPVPAEAIPERKRRRLRAAPDFARLNGCAYERLYAPAGVVRAIATAAGDNERALEQAVRFTPIVQRVAALDGAAARSATSLDFADRWGVGVVAVSEDRCEVVRRPPPAVLGIPAVYRWWLAELAYESWLQQSAQPVS